MIERSRVLEHLGTHRYGRSLSLVDETESTNDDAREAAERGAPEGHVVVADRQSRGRGSHGRAWSSPPETDLYFSIVTRPSVVAASLPPLTLAVGLGLAEAIEALSGGTRARVKWPNDVWLGTRKCAGVLVETTTFEGRLSAVIIGIGVNVNRRRFEPALRAEATSIAATSGHRVDRALALARLLESVESWVDRFVERGPGPVVDALELRLALRGEQVRLGEETGELLGVASTGAIRIRTADGVHEGHAGRLHALSAGLS